MVVNADGRVFAMARSVLAHPLDLPQFSLFAAALGALVRLSLLADEERRVRLIYHVQLFGRGGLD